MRTLRFFVHIGLPKTGTTYLQYHVFPRLGGVHTLRAFDKLHRISTLHDAERILLTDEGLLVSPAVSGWRVRRRSGAKLLKDIFGDVPLIIGFRRQPEFVLSLYKQYLQIGGTRRIDEYFSPTDKSAIIRPDDLIFTEWIDDLRSMFSSIFIYTQEDIRNNFNAFFESLCTFFGVEEPMTLNKSNMKANVGVDGQWQASMLRYMNIANQHAAAIPGVPSTYSPLARKLRISPRDVTQRYLRRFPSRPLALPNDIYRFLETGFYNDWNNVQRQRTITRLDGRSRSHSL